MELLDAPDEIPILVYCHSGGDPDVFEVWICTLTDEAHQRLRCRNGWDAERIAAVLVVSSLSDEGVPALLDRPS